MERNTATCERKSLTRQLSASGKSWASCTVRASTFSVFSCKKVLAEYEFYVGNFYYKKGSYNAAIGRFSGMLKDYPQSIRVPEALYYTGLSYEQLGQGDKAIHSLTALIDRFPSTELSIDAKKRIHSLDKEK